MGDHPRMCGEHWTAPGTRQPSLGSSPHVRGAQRQFRYHKLPSGIIPACAGSTHCPPTHLVSARDHPRMCGEHLRVPSIGLTGEGSSPHVRGAPVLVICACVLGGIIPACAGSTRLCGFPRRRWAGSSPHVRGARSQAAGSPSKRWDHPRMCGEHGETNGYTTFGVGSSPHVRGALFRARGGYFSRWDHPRMCGEHCEVVAPFVARVGSSPHVRGAHVRPCHIPPLGGIIPACAGSTPVSLACGSAGRDHPRMCGEHWKAPPMLTASVGSSPHVRGAPPVFRPPVSTFGIIPACAGST